MCHLNHANKQNKYDYATSFTRDPLSFLVTSLSKAPSFRRDRRQGLTVSFPMGIQISPHPITNRGNSVSISSHHRLKGHLSKPQLVIIDRHRFNSITDLHETFRKRKGGSFHVGCVCMCAKDDLWNPLRLYRSHLSWWENFLVLSYENPLLIFWRWLFSLPFLFHFLVGWGKKESFFPSKKWRLWRGYVKRNISTDSGLMKLLFRVVPVGLFDVGIFITF